VQLIQGGNAGRRPLLAAAVAAALMYAVGGRQLAQVSATALAGVMVTTPVALSDRSTRQLLRQWRTGERSPDVRRAWWW
jgi:hypothetical protein